MRHRVNKIRFKQGKDATRMLVRKLTVNFLTHSRIETTLKRAKVLKSVIEKLVEKAKVESEANKNKLLSAFNDKRLVDKMFKEIGKAMKDKVGGYVRIVRLGSGRDDGAEMARLEWAHPIVIEEKKLKKTNG